MEEQNKTKEIDVVALATKVLKEWKLLLSFMGVAAVVGVVVALSTPKTYTASVVLAPEMSSGGLGLSENLGEIASTFGVDLGSKTSMDAIYPELYPEIFASTDFVLKLFDVPVRLEEDNTARPYVEHIQKDFRVPFWRYPGMWLSKLIKREKPDGGIGETDSFRISKRDDKLCQAIRKSISCQVDKKTSVITINVDDQDPLAAAIMADTLQSRLQEYITNYRTKKARIDYEYYKKLYTENKQQYLKAQHEYAVFMDSNQGITLQTLKAKQEQLENEMQLSYNVYNQMAAQLHNAKAKIQERTPAFTIIERATMPHKASSMPRSFVVIVFVVLGGMADAFWVLVGRSFYNTYIKKRK